MMIGNVERDRCSRVFDHVNQVMIVVLANRQVKAQGLLTYLDEGTYLVRADTQMFGLLFSGWLTPQVLPQAVAHAVQPVDGFAQMHRKANRSSLVGNGAG